MERRTLLMRTGLALLPQAYGVSAQAERQNQLRLLEAPTRAVFEMVLKANQEGNFIIQPTVTGIVASLVLYDKSFDSTMTAICKASSPKTEWSHDNKIIRVQRKQGENAVNEELISRLQRARFPLIEGVACRVAGTLLIKASSWAVLEVGNPPDSTLSIVTLGSEVKLGKSTYHVQKITEKSLILSGAQRILQIPLASLWPSP